MTSRWHSENGFLQMTLVTPPHDGKAANTGGLTCHAGFKCIGPSESIISID
jgi:hypothetical protein